LAPEHAAGTGVGKRHNDNREGPDADETGRYRLNAQDSATLYFTSVSIAEISFGLHGMPDGKRQALLTERFERFLAQAFRSRILVFDAADRAG
jgi:hypothetical protein